MCCASGGWIQGIACRHRPATNFVAPAFAGATDRAEPQTKSPAIRPGFSIQIRERGLRRLVRRSDGLVAVGLEIFLAFALTFGTRLSLGAAARAFGELAFEFLHPF